MTLDEAIASARVSSPLAYQAANTYRARYWSFQSYKSNYLPQLALDATLPDFNRAIDPILQPDGTIQYIDRSVASWGTNLTLSQNVGKLGGNLYLRSSLNRFDNLSGRATNFQTNPVLIGYQQPIMQFNGLKWDQRIEPVRYQEATKQFHEDMEVLAVTICDQYFNLLEAQVNAAIARKNLESNDTLYKIAQGRYNLGKIAENELLQLELGFINSQQQVIRSDLDVKTASLRLKNLIGLTIAEDIEAVEPGTTPEFIASEEDAIAEARKNRARAIGFNRSLLEAERDVAQAVGETGFQGNLNVSFGLSQTAPSLTDSYRNPLDQQRANISFSMPILDWGRRKSRRMTAMSNQELVKAQVNQQERNFDQEVYLTVKQYEMAHQQLKVSAKASEVGQKRFDIARERYLIGKISITDLNIAFLEKDQARQGYINSLRSAWTNYYQLRRSTLYDFERKQVINYELPL